MAELEQNLLEFIEDIKPIIRKELKFLKTSDWTVKPTLKKRQDAQKLEVLFTRRAIKNAETLFFLAGTNIENPIVNKIMTDLVSFYEIAKGRYDVYTKKEDWTTYVDENGDITGNIEAELEFQSKVLNDVSELRGALKKINFGSANKSLEIKTFSNVAIPLVMHQAALRRYPEIKNYLDNNEKSGIFTENS